MTTDDHLDRLAGITGSPVSTARQIEPLVRAAEKHEAAIVNLERQWQAYPSTLRRQ